MESKQQADDNGVTLIERLNPAQVDVVLGSHPRRKPLPGGRKSRPYGLVIACLAFVSLACWVSSALLVRPAPALVAASAPIPEDTQAVPQAPAMEPPAAETTRPAARPVSYVAPQAAVQPAATGVKPLDNCIKDGNVIDESVLNCRFGEVPRPAHTEPAKGMVSHSYLADFKSSAARKEEPRAKPYTLVSMSIREWDGSDRYRAEWRMYDNHIDQDSVCGNFTSRSVERRECRKSAQGHFKELCREWTRRAARDRDKKSADTEQRYCEVATTFTP